MACEGYAIGSREAAVLHAMRYLGGMERRGVQSGNGNGGTEIIRGEQAGNGMDRGDVRRNGRRGLAGDDERATGRGGSWPAGFAGVRAPIGAEGSLTAR